MALPILDGNQTAATLSTVLTGGEHIPAHTVVSLGSQAITDMRSAVSGSVVSISNFPTTQTIAGTVTANVPLVDTTLSGGVTQAVPVYLAGGKDGVVIDEINYINNIPAISGTVTVGALPSGVDFGQQLAEGYDNYGGAPVQIVASSVTLPISGTVTANGLALGQEIANVFPIGIGQIGGAGVKAVADLSGYYVPVAVREISSVTIGSLPAISGTVTVGNYQQLADTIIDQTSFYAPLQVSIQGAGADVPVDLPSGALTTRFGSVVTANSAFITSAVTNTSRKYLLAQNISAGTVTIGIGFSPTTTQGIQLPAGGGLTFDAFCPTGAVYWLGAVTGAAFTILEG
jgi:hypothetical protein